MQNNNINKQLDSIIADLQHLETQISEKFSTDPLDRLWLANEFNKVTMAVAMLKAAIKG